MKSDEKKQKQDNNVLYVVLKLNTGVVAINPFNGEEVKILLEGCAGYLPVYDNRKQAEDAAMNGKYEIIKIITK